MSPRLQDEHTIVLGAEALAPCVCRIPRAVWVNRPRRRRLTLALKAILAIAIVLGLSIVVIGTGPEAPDIVVRAAAPPFALATGEGNPQPR